MMDNVFTVDFKRKSKVSKPKGLGDKLYSLDVYSDTDGTSQVYRYRLNGGSLVVLSPEIVLDSLTHLIPDIIGYCTDPSIVLECEEVMIAQIYELRDARRGKK